MDIWGPVLVGGLLLYVAVCFGFIAAKYNRNSILYGALSVLSPLNLVVLGYWAYSSSHATPGSNVTARRGTGAWGGVALYLGVIVVLIALLVVVTRTFLPPTGAVAGLVSLAMFTPALAALATRVIRREGFGDAGLRLGRWRWYLIAWALPLGMVALDFGWLLLLGYARLDLSPARLVALSPGASEQGYQEAIPGLSAEQALLVMTLASLTVANVPMVLAGLGEEFGWRGYLLPRLLRLGVWPAFVGVGVIWWAWHLPLGLLSPTPVRVNVALSLAAGVAGAILFGAILGWLRYASTSIFPVALAHIAYNNASGAGHILFDVDFNAIVVARVADVVLVCALITWWQGWKLLPVERQALPPPERIGRRDA